MAPPPPAYPKKEKCKPAVPMKQFHWAPVPDKRLKGSVWDKEVDDTKVKLDKAELEALFATKPSAAPATKAEEAPKTTVVSLLDSKRATSLATALQGFKSTLKLSQEAVCHALRDGDLTAFSSERMEVRYALKATVSVAA